MSSPVVERSLDGEGAEVPSTPLPGPDVVSVSGEFEGPSDQLVERVVAGATQVSSTRVILDLSRVTFMDARAVGAIVRCRGLLVARSADLALVCPGGPALRLLTVLGLDRVWPIYLTRDEALQAVA